MTILLHNNNIGITRVIVVWSVSQIYNKSYSGPKELQSRSSDRAQVGAGRP